VRATPIRQVLILVLIEAAFRYGIRGGYISTSALSSEGLETLLETLKALDELVKKRGFAEDALMAKPAR
jgi:hypothetical protein